MTEVAQPCVAYYHVGYFDRVFGIDTEMYQVYKGAHTHVGLSQAESIQLITGLKRFFWGSTEEFRMGCINLENVLVVRNPRDPDGTPWEFSIMSVDYQSDVDAEATFFEHEHGGLL